jgi:serine/threonine protein kinase
MKTFGYNSTYNILIMELLGPSLENLFQKLNQKFSIKTSCMLGIQMIDRIEYVHSKKIIHRDIKPDNFLIGRGNKSHIVYVLDFGLSKKYWSSKKNKHIPYCTNKKLTGTARYASINALSGCEQGRRDDLESIGYIIMYFILGHLPWQGLKVNNKEDRYKKICDKKKATSAKELCKGYPIQLEYFINYTRNLKFMEIPDYNYLRNLLKEIIHLEHNNIDFYYDWCRTKPNIDKNDIIYTNNYNIKYDSDIEWLNKKYCSDDNDITGKIYINKNNLIPEHSMSKIMIDDEEKNNELIYKENRMDED